MLKVLLSFLFSITASTVIAQVFPGEGDVINYRLAGFTALKEAKAEKYLFEVAEYNTSEKGKIIAGTAIEKLSDSNRAIIMLPYFDRAYMWRVSYLNKRGKVISTSPYTYFHTGKYPTVDSNLYRLKIIDSATHHDDIYVILDFISVIYDLKGNPVWYLPDIHLVADKNLQMRDIKPTQDGTFTATSNFGAFEINYNGKIIWKAPNDGKVNNDTMEYFHHEFTKLDNGNYMGATLEYVMRKVPSWVEVQPDQVKAGVVEKRDDGYYYRRVTAGNLVEYNKNKELVWYWKSTDHFNDSDFFSKRVIHGINTDMHLNAFDFDEKEKAIYMSFRNTNEVVKIEYPSGKILKRYGTVWINDSTKDNTRLFYGQHCTHKGSDGRLYMFNNNSDPASLQAGPERRKSVSRVSVFEETNTKTGLKNVFDFGCDIDTFAETHGGAGGSVCLLDDGCILVSMGSASRIFIVSPDKQIQWNVIPQSGDQSGNWYPLGQYRVSFIKRADLEKFILK